jgi:hypothetical protein
VNADVFDALARATEPAPDRRTALKAAGAALAGAILASPGSAAARKRGKSRGNTRRKRCKREKKQCRSAARDFCADRGGEVQECLADLLPCCATCRVKTGVFCVLGLIE